MKPTAPDLKLVTPPAAAIERLVEDYLDACAARGLSPKTIRFAYGYPLRQVFLPWCMREGITEPSQLTKPVLDRFTTELREQGGKGGALAPHSIATYASTVNLFLGWAQQEGKVEPGVKAQRQKKPKLLMTVLTRQEMLALEKAARNERDKLIVRVLIDTGMRLGELVGLRGTSLVTQKEPNRRTDHYLHVTGKGSRDRLVPIDRDLYERLKKYIADYRPQGTRSDRLFLARKRRPHRDDFQPLTGSGVNQLINTLAQEAGIKKRVYPHLLRHSFATWALTLDVGPLQLAKVLGHSSLTMINDVYSHLAPHDTHAALMRALLREEQEEE